MDITADNKNIDVLLASLTEVNSLHLTINLDYKTFEKFDVRFNIDVIEFSSGVTGMSSYVKMADQS